jgi:hypothetical protein
MVGQILNGTAGSEYDGYDDGLDDWDDDWNEDDDYRPVMPQLSTAA